MKYMPFYEKYSNKIKGGFKHGNIYYETKKMDDSYRKVEAMYRKGLSTDEIAKAVNLDRMDVLDIEQKIYHLDVRARKFN